MGVKTPTIVALCPTNFHFLCVLVLFKLRSSVQATIVCRWHYHEGNIWLPRLFPLHFIWDPMQLERQQPWQISFLNQEDTLGPLSRVTCPWIHLEANPTIAIRDGDMERFALAKFDEYSTSLEIETYLEGISQFLRLMRLTYRIVDIGTHINSRILDKRRQFSSREDWLATWNNWQRAEEILEKK